MIILYFIILIAALSPVLFFWMLGELIRGLTRWFE